MKPYWNEMLTPRPGLPIREVELKHDNVYIKDGRGQIWHLWISHDDQPTIELLDREYD